MPINGTDFEYISQLVRDRTGIVLTKDKRYLVESRLAPLLKNAQVDSIKKFVALLRQENSTFLHDFVIEAMVTTETSFFRDNYPFQALSNFLLPELIKKRKDKECLDIWCAACSSGQEPYSIAMLLQEYFPHLLSWQINLLASDISASILARSRTGCYSYHEISRGLSKTLLNKYFLAQDKSWQLKAEILSMVEFRQLNLTEPWFPMAQMDIIFLRNVLIYFDVEMKQSILAKVQRLLHPQGYLFLGAGETTINLNPAFEPVQVGKAVCYQLRPR